MRYFSLGCALPFLLTQALPSGLTRGPPEVAHKTKRWGSLLGPRVEPEGSTVVLGSVVPPAHQQTGRGAAGEAAPRGEKAVAIGGCDALQIGPATSAAWPGSGDALGKGIAG